MDTSVPDNPLTLEKPVRVRTAAWAGGLLLVVGLTWTLMILPPTGAMPYLRAGLVGFCFLLVPGFLMRLLILPDTRWPLLIEIPLSFGLSVVVGAIAWLVTRLLDGSLGTLGLLTAGGVTLLSVLTILLRRPERLTAAPLAAGEAKHRVLALVCLCLGILFWTLIVFKIGAYYMPRTDNWYYLAIVRRMLLSGSLTPGDPFFAGVADAERSGPWLAMVALWAVRSGMDIVALWGLLPALVMPVALLAFYSLAWMLFKDGWAAAVSVLLILAGRSGFIWNQPMMMAVPSYVALLLSFVSLGFAIEYGRSGKVGYLVVVGLLLGTTAAQHFLVFGGSLLMLLAFGLAQLGLGVLTSRSGTDGAGSVSSSQWLRSGGRLLAVAALAALIAVPAILFWSQSVANTTNPIYKDLWGLFKELGPWRVLRVSSLSGGPHLFAFSFLLLPFLLLRARRDDWAVFLLAMMVLVALIGFTPPIVELLLRSGVLPPWGIWRLVLQVYPFQLTVAAFACWAARRIWPSMLSLFGGRQGLALLAMAGALMLALVPNATPVVDPLLSYVRWARSPNRTAEAAAWLQQGSLAALPPAEEPLVVLSDASTSFLISGLTGHHVVAIPYGHASPLVADDQLRRDQVANLFEDEVDLEKARALLKDYGATAMVLVQEPALGEETLSPEQWEAWVSALETEAAEFPQLYREEGQDRRAAVYLWRSADGSP